MGRPTLITMLTHNDKTVPNSKEIFLKAKDAPCMHWGLKDVGLPKEEIREIVSLMKEAGKKTYLECLAYDEESAYNAMQFGIDCDFDVVMGTFYFDKVGDLAEKYHVNYYPFVGCQVAGDVFGTVEENVEKVLEIAHKKVTGVDFCGYRWVNGNPEDVIDAVVKAVKTETGKPVFCVGSINTFERLDAVKRLGVDAITIGSAFFDHKFGDSFADQIRVVEEYLDRPL